LLQLQTKQQSSIKETQQYTDADKQPFETQNGINLTVTIKSPEHPHHICIPSPCTPFHTITWQQTTRKGHHFSRSEVIKSCGHWIHANICYGSEIGKAFIQTTVGTVHQLLYFSGLNSHVTRGCST